jgi:pimeloyl-ACP methyl ester carboxylesterase
MVAGTVVSKSLATKVLHFGEGGALLGAYHQPARLRPRSAAVLLCNPFGEEAARSHRTFRVLAQQLERAGYAVLRFDYRGTGDSAGAGADATVAWWQDDVVAAAAELRRASGIPRLAVVGLRLGATLAALATRERDLAVRHLIAWDPIVRGAAYLTELAAQHRAYLYDELGPRWRPPPADGPLREALGAPIGPTLAAELAAIDLTAAPPRADAVTLLVTGAGADQDTLRARLPAAHVIAAEASDAWNSDAAVNAAVVPMDLVQLVVRRIEETLP